MAETVETKLYTFRVWLQFFDYELFPFFPKGSRATFNRFRRLKPTKEVKKCAPDHFYTKLKK